MESKDHFRKLCRSLTKSCRWERKGLRSLALAHQIDNIAITMVQCEDVLTNGRVT